MKTRLLMSAAAIAVLAGSGVVYAQSAGSGSTGGGAGAAQQSGPSTQGGAPAERGSASTQMNRDSTGTSKGAESGRGSEPGMKSSDSMTRDGARSSQNGGKEGERDRNQRAQDGSGSKSGKDSGKDPGKEMRSGDTLRDGNKNAVDQSRDGDSRSTTTGQAGGAKLSSDQRTQITTVIKQQRIEPASNVNFSIAVGSRVPREVRFHPLPTEIISIYPDWRGYEFFLARGEIIVVNPRTMEIVAVLPA